MLQHSALLLIFLCFWVMNFLVILWNLPSRVQCIAEFWRKGSTRPNAPSMPTKWRRKFFPWFAPSSPWAEPKQSNRSKNSLGHLPWLLAGAKKAFQNAQVFSYQTPLDSHEIQQFNTWKIPLVSRFFKIFKQLYKGSDSFNILFLDINWKKLAPNLLP